MSMDFRIIENYSAHLVAGEDVDATEYPALCACCGRAIGDGEVIINEVCPDCIAESRKQRIRDICEKEKFALSAMGMNK